MENSFTLLFVVDEVEFLATMEEFFEDLGYTVHTACNGMEALAKSKQHRPHAVFLDISMPGMDGTEVLHLIHNILPDAQVIIVSGYASEDFARTLLKQGACDFFQKPVDLMRLHEAVKQLQTTKDLS